MFLVLIAIYVILENFQKLPGGLLIAAKRHMLVYIILGSWRGTAWQHIPGRQATHGVFTNFWIFG